MSYLLTVVVFIIVFSVLVLIHELGHFVMAKRAGIKVEEFGLGLPPRIWGKKIGETIYSINYIPFGGFVRMLGEDAGDPKMLKNKRSFASQSMRKRVKVVVAGVVMNFFLAWLLLTIALSVGMEPLMGPDDVLPAASEGVIQLEAGLIVDSIKEGSLADKANFQEGDVLYSVDSKFITADNLFALSEEDFQIFEVFRNGEKVTLDLRTAHDLNFLDEMGLGFLNFVSFPRVIVFDLEERGQYFNAGLQKGDVMLKVNERPIFNVEQFEDMIRGQNRVKIEVYRKGEMVNVEFIGAEKNEVIIASILPESPAAKAGLLSGDIIRAIDGRDISDISSLIDLIKGSDDFLRYQVLRAGDEIAFDIKPEEGAIGVLLTELISYGNLDGLSLYTDAQLSSIVEIKHEQYPFYIAAGRSFTELWRLSKLTTIMLGDYVKNRIVNGEVSGGVAGPVGIFKMTHVFLHEGIIPLLRFVALLSLSLAVLNILPIPALDGGRLFFIIIELFLGRRVNQRWESSIHAIGYLLVLGLILLITYDDIVSLIS